MIGLVVRMVLLISLWLTVVLPPFPLFLPILSGESKPQPPIEWDTRLDQRGAVLHVESGAKYRVVRGRWLDQQESGGRHHVFVTVLDKEGNHAQGKQVIFFWSSGQQVKTYNGAPIDFPMFAVAPAYGIRMAESSDRVDGLGMGSIEAPFFAIHTSYEFTFQETE